MTFKQFAISSILASCQKKWDGKYSFDPPKPTSKLYKEIITSLRNYNRYKSYGLVIRGFWYDTRKNEFTVHPYAKGQDLTSYRIDPETLEVWQ